MPNKSYYGNNSSYGKRPIWQWILIYIIIGGLVYFAIYYIFFRSKYNYSSGGTGGASSSYSY